ncbi:MAG: c-type cytochrome [Alphaproteobacteria bacterium]
MRRISLALFALLIMVSSAHAEEIVGESARGALLFSARCSVCHASNVNKNGPLMHGVLGRKAGSVSYFAYSPAMRDSKLVWNKETLDAYLADPPNVLPGTTMYLKVPVAKDRADIIAYLKGLSVPLAKPLDHHQ